MRALVCVRLNDRITSVQMHQKISSPFVKRNETLLNSEKQDNKYTQNALCAISKGPLCACVPVSVFQHFCLCAVCSLQQHLHTLTIYCAGFGRQCCVASFFSHFLTDRNSYFSSLCFCTVLFSRTLPLLLSLSPLLSLSVFRCF